MDFRHIEAFIKVVELASFSKAADELHVSQPSISAYIAALEKELGAVLINRSTRVASTTLAGERFLVNAKQMLSLKRETVEMLRNLSGDISGDIRILASSVPALYILPEMLAGFHSRHPKISFTVRQADTSEVMQGLTAHKADIGFAGSVLGDSKCDFYEFTDEKLVLIAPAHSAYREDQQYSLDEVLYQDNFIARELGSGTRMQYEKFFAESGIALDKIKTTASMDSTQGIITAVQSGLGVSIVSLIAAQQKIAQGQLVQIRLDTALPTRKIYAVLSRNTIHSHLTELFMEYITKEADGSWKKSG